MTKALSICMVMSMLMTFGVSAVFSVMSRHSAVLSTEDVALIQLDAPQSGAPKATVHTTLGDMTFVLYPEECPQTVENFIALAEDGYYNDTCVFRVEPDIFFSAGAPNADGTLNEGSPAPERERVPRELSAKLWPLRGALCALTTDSDAGFWKLMTNKQQYFTGSRFLVADTIEMTDEIKAELTEEDSSGKKSEIGQAFAERGGIPNYSQQITVFGQLTEGFDVLDAITGCEVTGAQDDTRPKDEIRILSVEISEFP